MCFPCVCSFLHLVWLVGFRDPGVGEGVVGAIGNIFSFGGGGACDG